MAQVSALFPGSYEESRARFRGEIHRVQRLWPSARLGGHRLAPAEDDDLTIDWIEADPLERREKLLILTTGEHGIEGYVGSAMLRLFLEEPPRIEDITRLTAREQVVVVPFFISDGLHCQEDIPLLLGERPELVAERLGRGERTWVNPIRKGDRKIWLSPAVGTAPGMTHVILDCVREEMRGAPGSD